jgi:hypothetical protein
LAHLDAAVVFVNSFGVVVGIGGEVALRQSHGAPISRIQPA